MTDNGNIKEGAYTDGIKQCFTMSKVVNVSLPTVSLEKLFLTLLMDANENRDVAMFDVPCAFLQPEIPKSKK